MRHYVFTALVVLLVAEIFSVMPTPPKDLPSVKKGNYLSGIIHVHSRYSDGSGGVEDIARAAERAGADFVVLTDHNRATARRDGLEKNYGNVDLFVEMEATTPVGQALMFYSHTDAVKLPDERVVKLAYEHYNGTNRTPGVFVVVAHPSHIKNPWSSLDRFPDGIEVINFDSQWERQLYESVLSFSTTVGIYPFNNFLSALRFNQVYRKDFTAWDNMNAVSSGHFGILAHDSRAKTKLGRSLSLEWPTYEQSFRVASNVVYYDPPLATDFEARKKQIYKSLKEGKGAMVYQFLHPFEGNEWHLECGGKSYRPGETAPLAAGCDSVVSVPESFPFPHFVRIWKDGELYREVEMAANPLSVPLKIQTPGAYRVEVWAKIHTLLHLLESPEVPYVFYNPIYVK